MFSHDIGRFDPFGAPSGNDPYLREGDGWNRPKADMRLQ
jgi:hypothetical protein